VSSWRRSGQPCSLPCLGIIIIDQAHFVNLNNTQSMDFVEAAERLKSAVTDDEIAEATGVSTNTIRRTRADPNTRNYRPAPFGWEKALAKIAYQRAQALLKLQQELEAAGSRR
jgi:hypothetical protein